jgi:hypothetical protein
MNDKFHRSLKFALPISLIVWSLMIFFSLILFSGCTALVPNYVAPEIEHMSHATQHAPISADPTNYGANIASVVVGYNLPHHVNIEIADGVALNRHYAGEHSCGEIMGPREQFSLRVRYVFQVRP